MGNSDKCGRRRHRQFVFRPSQNAESFGYVQRFNLHVAPPFLFIAVTMASTGVCWQTKHGCAPINRRWALLRLRLGSLGKVRPGIGSGSALSVAGLCALEEGSVPLACDGGTIPASLRS